MTHKESNDSVHDEQFGQAENTEKNEQTKDNDPASKPDSDAPADDNKPQVTVGDTKAEPVLENEPDNTEDNSHTNDDSATEQPVKDASVVEPIDESMESVSDPESSALESEAEPNKAPDDTLQTETSETAEDKLHGNEIDDSIVDDTTSETKVPAEEVATETNATGKEQQEATPPKYVPEEIDYTKLSKEDLVKVLKDLIDAGQIPEIRRDVEAIKSNFYKKNKAEVEAIKNKFLEEGGQIQDFKHEESPVEQELKQLLNKYRELRHELGRKQESEKDDNLKEKYEIIEKIKELINSQESLNKTFHDFRELQNRWREIGPVPQGNLKDLWESYHYHVEAFYDYIKINKELRDLDFKKNLEAKIKLCESAEELLLEPSVVEAFRLLQKLHDQWREIGPVPIDQRSDLWERFKDATTKINRKHQEYFVNLKQEQKKNYEEKIVLCEKAEEIVLQEIENPKDFEVKSKELIELQKVWKTIGFAPKKYNTQIYERFRKACDTFFDKKRDHYSHNREEQQNNLQLKTELCIQAEALQNSKDWKKTTNELIALQKKWKTIGPVPSKLSEKVWKRFRAACDTFFNNKSEYYSHIDSHYEGNLQKKKELIAEIEKFELSEDMEKNLSILKEYQRKWSEIGFVPIKLKDEIQDQYRSAINARFDQLKLDENKKAVLKYRNRLEGIAGKPNAEHRFRIERDKCFAKLNQLENDITLWENNIGFFANSENAESMIEDVNKKIESAKRKIEQLKSKIRLLDEFED